MSGYVSALPVNVNNTLNEKILVIQQDQPTNLEIKPFWHNQDDVDIKDKDIRENVVSVRKLYEQRVRPD